jgi:Zinc-finger double-stranded RNA-binding
MLYLIPDEYIQSCSAAAQIMPAPVSDSRTSVRSAKRRKGPRNIPTECVYCKAMFSSRTAAYLHAYNDHKDIETARCKDCFLCLKTKIDLRIHRRDFHKFRCVYCTRHFINEKAYQKHVSSMHASEVIECKLCKNSCVYYKTQALYAKHVARKHEGAWKCIYCTDDNNFRFKNSLRSHIRHHHQNVSIECSRPICATFFKTEAEKSDHEKAVHASKADVIECEICNATVLRPNLSMHMLQFPKCRRIGKVKGEKTTCCYCQKTFPSKTAVMRHVKESHSNIDTFSCQTCMIYFPTLKLKQEHNQKVHSGSFTCIYCSNWSCTNMSNLGRHMKEKHEGEVIQCKYNNMCNLYFKTDSDLQKHISECHENDLTNKLQCIYCSKIFPRYNLLPHINFQHKSVAIRCSYSKTCCTYFLTKEDQDSHVLKVHYNGKVVENQKCPLCDKIFLNFFEINNHAQNIHGETLIKCRERGCLFMCSSSVHLQKHLLEQHAETQKLKIHGCKICNHKSKSRGNLNKHYMRMHGTEKLKCSMCSKNDFKSTFSLNSHINSTHLQKKSEKVKCVHCNLSVLYLYLHNHVIQRPCKLCDKIFTCGGLMQKHRSTCKPIR